MTDHVAAGEQSSLGMQPNVAAMLSYILGLLSGLIVFLLEKKSRFVRFHAMQSMLFAIALFVCSLVAAFIPVINAIAGLVLTVGGLIIWVLLVVKSLQGAYVKLPVLGAIAEKNANPPVRA